MLGISMLILLSAITFSDKAGGFALFLSQKDHLRDLRKVSVVCNHSKMLVRFMDIHTARAF